LALTAQHANVMLWRNTGYIITDIPIVFVGASAIAFLTMRAEMSSLSQIATYAACTTAIYLGVKETTGRSAIARNNFVNWAGGSF